MPTLTRKFTIVIEGDTEASFEDARAEATRLINEGYLSGHDANTEGAFYFDSTDQVPDTERPAR